jgi:hypothetical protein
MGMLGEAAIRPASRRANSHGLPLSIHASVFTHLTGESVNVSIL